MSREELQKPSHSENSETVRSRVKNAREKQLKRQGCANNILNNKDIEKYCTLSNEDEALLGQIMEKFRLSARAYHRILKVARTIADLEGSANIQTKHISETISYRAMDKYNVG